MAIQPTLPYAFRSRSFASQEAVGNFDDAAFPGDPRQRLVRTGEQLTGAHFPNGQVEAVDANFYANLMTARVISTRGTLHQYHVNLESRTGQHLKQSMKLPFQAHSRVDPMKAALQPPQALEDLFGFSKAQSLVKASEKLKAGIPLSPAFENMLKEWGNDLGDWEEGITAFHQIGLGAFIPAVHVPPAHLAGAVAVAHGEGVVLDTSEELIQVLSGAGGLSGGDLMGIRSRRTFKSKIDLSTAERESLTQYQISAAINDHLRGTALRDTAARLPGVFESPAATRAYVDRLDRVTRAQAVTRPYGVFRGLYAQGELRDQFHPGQIFREPGYSSTALTSSVATEFLADRASSVTPEERAANSLFLKIKLPKGYRVSAHLAGRLPHVGTGQKEAEVLLRRGAPLRIRMEKSVAALPGHGGRPGYTIIEAEALRFARGRRLRPVLPVSPATAAEASTPALLKDGLQQIHTNLESEVGKFLKFVMRLPFKKHSRIDTQEAALQAYRTFQNAPHQFLAARSHHSPAETAAASRYKGFGFTSINNALRTDPLALTAEGRQTVNTLDALTHSGVVQQDFSVHRGFSGHGLDKSRALVGQEFSDQGFVSTSLNPYVVDEFARTKEHFTAEVRLPRGSKGFLLSSHETWKQSDKEAEFVLPRGTTFKVLEEHAAESAWAPRHLVLEAITPEHAPSPLQLGKQVAQEVRPTARGAMATAEKMVAKGTANELHTVLESGVGGFLKKLLKIPLKAHSQTDALAAALQATKAVDAQGRPLRLYHGTTAVFRQFDFGMAHTEGLFGPGAYFTADPHLASTYAMNTPRTRYRDFGTEQAARDFAAGITEGKVNEVRKVPGGGWVVRYKEPSYSNVHAAYLDVRNPVNMDDRADPRLVKRVRRLIDKSVNWGHNPLRRQIREQVASEVAADEGALFSGTVTNAHLFDLLAEVLRGKPRAQRYFRALGYDSITHMGGRRLGNVEHTVFIALQPNQIFGAWAAVAPSKSAASPADTTPNLHAAAAQPVMPPAESIGVKPITPAVGDEAAALRAKAAQFRARGMTAAAEAREQKAQQIEATVQGSHAAARAPVGVRPITTAQDLHAAASAPPVMTTARRARLRDINRRLSTLAEKNRQNVNVISIYEMNVSQETANMDFMQQQRQAGRAKMGVAQGGPDPLTPPSSRPVPPQSEPAAPRAGGFTSSAGDGAAAGQTASQVTQAAEKEATLAFHGPVLAGILVVGALFAGGVALSRHHPATHSSTWNDSTPEPTHTGPQEQKTHETQTRRRGQGAPRSTANIHLHDADLDHRQIDEMFSKHFSRGYAVTSSSYATSG